MPVIQEWHSREFQDGPIGGHAVGHYPSSLTERLLALAHAMGSELCRVHDLVDKRGGVASSHIGRARGVETAQRLSLPKRSSASLGKVFSTISLPKMVER